VRRVNHSVEYKAEDGANVNQAESVVPRESEAVPLIREHVASGSIIHADESNAWERLHASYDVLFAVAPSRNRPASSDQRSSPLPVRKRSGVARGQPPQVERDELEYGHWRGAR
jgi:hypothetical protein